MGRFHAPLTQFPPVVTFVHLAYNITTGELLLRQTTEFIHLSLVYVPSFVCACVCSATQLINV